MNKKRISRIASLLIAAVLILSSLSACGPSGGNTANNSGNGGNGGGKNSAGGSKNAYGFTSTYEEPDKEEQQLKNFPGIKEALLALEKTLTANGVSIEKIAFDGRNTPAAAVWLGITEDGEYSARNYISLSYLTDKDSGAVTLYEMESKLFDASKDAAVRKAMLAAMDFTDIEKTLAAAITGDEEVQTMEYYICCYNGKESLHPNMDKVKTNSYEEYEKIYNQTKDLAYCKFEIINNPADNERQTSLYKYNREQRKPQAEGKNIDEYNLSFNIPAAMKTNPYSGMLAVWEYYTGEYDGISGYANGIDLGMMATTLNGKDLQTYITTDSRPAHSQGVTPFVAKEINGYTWYTCNNGRYYYYAAEFAGRVYEIEVRYTSVIDGVTLEDTLSLLEKTLFFE